MGHQKILASHQKYLTKNLTSVNKCCIFTSSNKHKQIMRHITDLRTWNNPKKNDFRVYVTFDDKSEGCYYKDGNAYNVKGTLENMTLEEKKAALTLSEAKHGKNVWGEVRHWEINKAYKADEEDLDMSSRNEMHRDRYGIADM